MQLASGPSDRLCLGLPAHRRVLERPQTVVISQAIDTISIWRESDQQNKYTFFFECHKVRFCSHRPIRLPDARTRAILTRARTLSVTHRLGCLERHGAKARDQGDPGWSVLGAVPAHRVVRQQCTGPNG